MTEDQRTARSGWGWVVLFLAVLATIAFTGVVDWFVMFAQSSTCYDRPDAGQVRSGRIGLAVVLAVAVAPWALATWMSRRRVGVGVAGLVAVTPAFLFLLDGFRSDAWVGGFCF